MLNNYHSYAILGAGSVNLRTANSKYFNVIANAHSGPATLILVKGINGKYKVISGSGKPSDYGLNAGGTMMCHADQSGRTLPDVVVVAKGETSLETLASFRQITGKTSVAFAVFK